MVKTETPIVRSYEPAGRSRTMMRIGNALMVPLLRSRMGARMHDLALLSYTGRRTGRRYEIPVGYHAFEDAGVVVTASGWRVNLRGGAEVEIVHDGARRPMRAELIEDPDEVARVYRGLLERVGLSKAMRVGLKVDGERMPTHDELVRAIGGMRSVVRLTPR